MSGSAVPTVVTRRDGRAGRILLNRPKALNALDLGMIRSIAEALDAWRDDPAVHAVVIEGAGGRAFCAGGDIRAIRAAVLAGQHEEIETFFREEYAINLAIATYPKPYVALVDGICMGGGIGLSVHGALRVVTDGAMLAMPETGIALFPDIGATYVYKQLSFMRNQSLGYKQDQMLIVKAPPPSDSSYFAKVSSFQNEIHNNPSVNNIASSSDVPGETIVAASTVGKELTMPHTVPV